MTDIRVLLHLLYVCATGGAARATRLGVGALERGRVRQRKRQIGLNARGKGWPGNVGRYGLRGTSGYSISRNGNCRAC